MPGPPVWLSLALAVALAGACTAGGDGDGDEGRATPAPPPASAAASVTAAPPVPEARTEVGGGLLGDDIVVLGGLRADGSATDRVDVYDPGARSWSAGPPMPAPLHHAAAASLGGRLFVAGGYTMGAGGAWVETAEVWSLGAGERRWRGEPAMTSARGALGLAPAGDRLVAFGGTSAGRPVATSEVLDAGASAWRPGPPLAQAREHTAGATAGGRVYAIAGRVGSLESNLTSVESLDPGEGGAAAWRREPDLVQSRGGIAGAALGAVPCVAGGEAPTGTIAGVECLRGGRWERVADLRAPRHGLAVVAAAGRLHVIAGGPQPGLFVSDAHEVVALG